MSPTLSTFGTKLTLQLCESQQIQRKLQIPAMRAKSQQDEEFDDFVDRVDDVGTENHMRDAALGRDASYFSNLSSGCPLQATPCSHPLSRSVGRFACISVLGNAIRARGMHHPPAAGHFRTLPDARRGLCCDVQRKPSRPSWPASWTPKRYRSLRSASRASRFPLPPPPVSHTPCEKNFARSSSLTCCTHFRNTMT